ncbi:dienelactone hydrolase family protein [Pelagicoccus mobilis]|uniref:Dienelactone hydrolase family protein n=1 Tax=Pelagicoccus mobilis TaxID=415221 RepID=A0A934VTB7_9BACT|nr:dienelactone hydrolase family protein [Pelagicoccus mobilis]MBK1879905.1 dienelactone hydrolase family protein [Pelagicoccus mobilis]
MNKQHFTLLFVILALLAMAPLTDAQRQQPSEEQLEQALKRFPEADINEDGKLTVEEIRQFRQSSQRNSRRAAAAQPKHSEDAKPVEAQPRSSATEQALFNTEEILDVSTLDTKIIQDWHPVGNTRQKAIEINVADWWPGQDYRIPVRMIVPLEGKAKGFSITGSNAYEGLMKDTEPSEFEAKLLAGGVGIVKTHVKAFRQIPGKKSLEQKMQREFMKDLNPRYTVLWMWSMTLMRATTAAYAETEYFEPGKVAGSGSSKNGMSPAVALINDERFTATCSNHASPYFSPTRRAEEEEIAKAERANKVFFEAVKAGAVDLDQDRERVFRRVMVGSAGGAGQMAMKAGKSMDEMQNFLDRLWSSASVAENWDRLMERGVDILFEPGTHDYVAYDIVWGAQNHPQVPVYYQPNGGHHQTPHVATAKDEQNRDAFLWHHFFGGDSLLSPPASSHKVEKDKLTVRVSFEEGPQPTDGRIWWMYDRAPEGSAPFMLTPIPEDQWADMERDPKNGSWSVTIPLKDGASRIDFFSNHGHRANGYQQYLSSPYTRVKLSEEADSKIRMTSSTAPAAVQRTQAGGGKVAEKGGGPDQETKEQFIKRVERNTKKSGQQLDRKSIEARFQQMDANQDGIVTREERRARLNEAQTAAPVAAQPTASGTNTQSPQPSERQRAQILKRFPQADTDKDGKLSTEEVQAFVQSRQRRGRPAAAAAPPPTPAGDAKLAEALAEMNARFKNVEMELIEWPSSLHEKLGKMTKIALMTRPVEKTEGKLPLLINLHGGGQRWWDMSFEQQLETAARLGMKRGFDIAELAGKSLITLDPNTGERWVPNSLDTMLDYVLENFPEVDADRVYVMGYSAGGGATWRWINQSADRFAAAAPCGFTGGNAEDNWKGLANLPIWGMAGSEDGKNPAGVRKMVERLKAAGNANVKHTEFAGADHREGGKAVFNTVELVDWMLGFERNVSK